MPLLARPSLYTDHFRMAFSVLTFNVFIGSPIPRVNTFTPCLDGCSRLDVQLKRVTGAAADVACLQEVHSDSVESAYRTAFDPTHELFVGKKLNMRGRLAAHAIYVISAAVG